jgi:hypothetical protein
VAIPADQQELVGLLSGDLLAALACLLGLVFVGLLLFALIRRR